MPSKVKKIDAHTEQGQQLARRLYDFKIARLEHIQDTEKESLLKEYPLLGETEFDYVVQQLIATKRYEQERIGWQAVPHDVAVLIMVVVTSLLSLQVGVITGVAVLVLLENIFQFYFNRRLYHLLSFLVWFTYPAYIGLAYVLFRRSFPLVWIALIVLFTWVGSFLLGALARIPTRIFLEAKAKMP